MYCRSTDREGAIRQAKRHFHEYFMQGAEAEPGIKTDGVFKLLAPPYVAEKFLKMEDGSEPEGHAEWYGNFHVNYSWAMTLEEAIRVKESLEELIADPEIDFGPAYEMTKLRKQEALSIIKKEIRLLKAE